MFKNIKKLSYRFTLSVILAVLCIFLLTTLYAYNSESRQINDELAFKIEYTADMIAASLADPVWDYDYIGVSTFGDSVFKDRDIGFLMVLDTVSGELYNQEIVGEAYEPIYMMVKNKPILHDGEVIGSLSIGMTKYYGLEKLRNSMWFKFTELIISVITLSIIIFFISYQVTKPLSVLEMDVQALADGKERIKLSDYNEDEIGRLAENFNDMGDKIEQVNRELHEINSSLEEKVSHRTEELLEKNNELNLALETLQKTQNELIRSSKSKLTTRLVEGVAHEINTPLGLTITITTFIKNKVAQINMLKDDDTIPKEILMDLTKDIDEGLVSLETNLTRVTNLMSHFKQLMLENQQEASVAFDLNQYLKKVVGGLKMDLIGSAYDIELICDEICMINSYPNAYKQIVDHLTSNAILHGFNGRDQGKIEICAKRTSDTLVMSFSDDGIGMTPDVVENVFHPFYKGESKMNGSGLGLAIVDNIINVQLGGQIHCRSGLEKGTTFEIEIPLDI